MAKATGHLGKLWVVFKWIISWPTPTFPLLQFMIDKKLYPDSISKYILAKSSSEHASLCMHTFFLGWMACPCLPPQHWLLSAGQSGYTSNNTQGRQSQGDPLSTPDQNLMSSWWLMTSQAHNSWSQQRKTQPTLKPQHGSKFPKNSSYSLLWLKTPMLNPLPWYVHHRPDVSLVHELHSTWTVGNKNRSSQMD